MSTAIALAGPADALRVAGLMARLHEEIDAPFDDNHRTGVIAPLLEGSPLGAIWLIGPARAPLGYVLVSFGWSVPHGGMICWLEEAFIRANVRNRGIGTEVLHAISVSLKQAGLRAMLARPQTPLQSRFCQRVGLQPDEQGPVFAETLT